MSLSEGQFRAFRKLVLDIYGVNGRKVRELITQSLAQEWNGLGVLFEKKKGQTQSKEAVVYEVKSAKQESPELKFQIVQGP